MPLVINSKSESIIETCMIVIDGLDDLGVDLMLQDEGPFRVLDV